MKAFEYVNPADAKEAVSALTRAGEHRFGSIDADKGDARLRQRNGDAAGAASELEDGAVLLQRKRAPERHVTPAERPRVLPIVEGRVVVPAFVSFNHQSETASSPGTMGRVRGSSPRRDM